MKIYNLKPRYGLKELQWEEKEVLDEETEHSYFYLNNKGKKTRMAKSNNWEEWFKTKQECIEFRKNNLIEKICSLSDELDKENKNLVQLISAKID